MNDQRLDAGDPAATPGADPVADVAVIPVTDAATDTTVDPVTLVEQAAAANLAGLKESLGDLQTQLAGTAATGVPAVDQALEHLGRLDPEDLAGSAQILEEVLERLEDALRESPQE